MDFENVFHWLGCFGLYSDVSKVWNVNFCGRPFDKRIKMSATPHSWFRRLALLQEVLHFRVTLQFFWSSASARKNSYFWILILIFHQVYLFFKFEMMKIVKLIMPELKMTKKCVEYNQMCEFSACTSTSRKCSVTLKCSTKV